MSDGKSKSQQHKRETFRSVLNLEPSPRRQGEELSPSQPCFIICSEPFGDILGSMPELIVAERRQQKFAHEAGVWVASTNKNYFTSNYQEGGSIDVYDVDGDSLAVRQIHLPRKDIANANGACFWEGRVLFCGQGSSDVPSTLTAMDPSTGVCEVTLDNFYGRQFNSLNDVVVHYDTGDIWFTDPTYGWQQGFRPRPQLPSQVYRFRPSTGQLWCVANGIVECNGLCFSPDFTQLYVTDTGAVRARGLGEAEFDPTRPSTIYAYDVVRSGTQLINRRLFAFCTVGVPDGIKCDEKGNVYAGCGDGVHVWSADGDLLGKIYTQGMVANFNFSPVGIWVMAEETLYLCNIRAKGALEGLEAQH